ncbi:hypothetical protein NDU88_001561 [Pleurodeles waltl]|uniref:Uncharacterized protein n=1 Tax=Pleurodeles waltl TaxID=8319 RepID=A0AAV7VX65_PLEWA|nr:hypothetical protein NDU88_001561 [Pleurodeles waltl]
MCLYTIHNDPLIENGSPPIALTDTDLTPSHFRWYLSVLHLGLRTPQAFPFGSRLESSSSSTLWIKLSVGNSACASAQVCACTEKLERYSHALFGTVLWTHFCCGRQDTKVGDVITLTGQRGQQVTKRAREGAQKPKKRAARRKPLSYVQSHDA